ncbi:MAG: sulfite exporter TauE/SafE family protein [Hyphomicrobiaceae bacterium]|nr:sulfite exporter TauE/SafE family protein [Hyphomicrobiaceae bacterium]
MSAQLILLLAATMVVTAFLSGIFGMAGGMILMGVLLFLLPLPEAMALHAITQMASNGWRGVLWFRYVRWRPAVMFLAGCAVAFAIWSIWRYTPDKGVALVLLGVSPFLVRLVPHSWRPDPNKLLHGLCYGGVCMSLMLVAGVSGPLVDSYFLGGKFDRREIVATKAVCQVVSHGAKFLYFGSLVDQSASFDPLMGAVAVAASITGTSLARPILERLTEVQYRRWATRIILTIATVYLARGGYLLAQ